MAIAGDLIVALMQARPRRPWRRQRHTCRSRTLKGTRLAKRIGHFNDKQYRDKARFPQMPLYFCSCNRSILYLAGEKRRTKESQLNCNKKTSSLHFGVARSPISKKIQCGRQWLAKGCHYHLLSRGQHWVLEWQHWVLARQHWNLVRQHWVLAQQHLVLARQHCVLVGQHWVMARQHWVLVGKHLVMARQYYWVLARQHWVLVGQQLLMIKYLWPRTRRLKLRTRGHYLDTGQHKPGTMLCREGPGSCVGHLIPVDMNWRDHECQTINLCICNSLYRHLFLINHYCLFVCLYEHGHDQRGQWCTTWVLGSLALWA